MSLTGLLRRAKDAFPRVGTVPDMAALRSLTFRVVLVMSAVSALNGSVGFTSTSYTEPADKVVRTMLAVWACAHVLIYFLERHRPRPAYLVFLSGAIVMLAVIFNSIIFSPTERTGVHFVYFASLLVGGLIWLPFDWYFVFSAIAVLFHVVLASVVLRDRPEVRIGVLVPLTLCWLPSLAASFLLDRLFNGMRVAREELERHRERLTEEVAARTVTIRKQQEQLMSVEKLRAIGTLAGGISHDFNNFLTAMLGHANILRRGAQPGDGVHEGAVAIERAASRAAELTKQLLGFARGGKLRNTAVDMYRLVCEVLTLLSRTVDKRIEMTQRRGTDEAYVMGDPGQLEQVILNLAVNACDAMERGGELSFDTSTVELDAARAHELGILSGPHVLLTVSDNGEGMSKDVMAHVFEPFFTTKPEGKGTGMGLAMAYGIVRNHAGAMEVESVLGEGSTFKIYLPRTDRRPNGDSDSRHEGVIAGKGRILIVDDEEVVRNVLVRMLRILGYECITACDGREAIDAYGRCKGQFDLVIVDMAMPVMDGRDCFRALRKMDPKVRALLTTGHALDGAAQELLDEGMAGLIQKPYAMSSLSVSIADALGAD